jgi:hypothetical protein
VLVLIVWSIRVYRQVLLLLLPLLLLFRCVTIAQPSIPLRVPKPVRIPTCSKLLLWRAVCRCAAAAAAAALHLPAVHACRCCCC